MTESEAVKLIEQADFEPNIAQKWADLGCGSGLFSYALAVLLPRESKIFSVDKVHHGPFKLTERKNRIEFLQADFIQDKLPFIDLDGVLMANSLHYVLEKEEFLEQLKMMLSEKAKLIIVEYETEQSNSWIPYPIPLKTLREIAGNLGFSGIRKIGERPSRYGNKHMYAIEMSITSQKN